MLGKMRFDAEELTGQEKVHVLMLIGGMGEKKPEMLKHMREGYLTHSDVKDLLQPFRNVVAQVPDEPMGIISASVVKKFEDFLG